MERASGGQIPHRGSGAGLRVPLVLWLAAALPSGLPSRWEGPADRGVGLRHRALPGLHVEAVMDSAEPALWLEAGRRA